MAFFNDFYFGHSLAYFSICLSALKLPANQPFSNTRSGVTEEEGKGSMKTGAGGGYSTDGDVFDDVIPVSEDAHRDALAELDNVLSYHSATSSNGKSSGNSNKKAKKSSNASGTGNTSGRDRKTASVTAGGTWPRTRGGPVIDQGTGTILHPQKVKKERLPLAELLTGLPNQSRGGGGQVGVSSSPGQSVGQPQDNSRKVILRNEDVLSRSTRVPRSSQPRPLTTYELPTSEVAALTQGPTSSGYQAQHHPMMEPPPPPPMTAAASAAAAADLMRHHRHRSGGGGGAQQQQLASTPSENSIDESVKSAQVVIGKEVLEKYLEKLKTTGSVGSGQGTPGGQFWYHERHEDAPQATGVVHPFSR